MPQALVFDYDGVLADTEPLHWKSWAALLLPFDFHLTWEEYDRNWLGLADDKIFRSVVERTPRLNMEELARLNDERKRKVRAFSLAESPIPRETIQLLETLKANRIGMVTSSERAYVEPVLRASGIFDRFDAIVFGDDVAVHKPAPDPYLLIAKNLGVSTGTAFEDSDSGMQSALAAGFKAVRIEHPKDLAQIVAQTLRNQAG
jgi:beta-phosphoglucomutase